MKETLLHTKLNKNLIISGPCDLHYWQCPLTCKYYSHYHQVKPTQVWKWILLCSVSVRYKSVGTAHGSWDIVIVEWGWWGAEEARKSWTRQRMCYQQSDVQMAIVKTNFFLFLLSFLCLCIMFTHFSGAQEFYFVWAVRHPYFCQGSATGACYSVWNYFNALSKGRYCIIACFHFSSLCIWAVLGQCFQC